MSSNGQMPPADELDFGIVTGQHWRSWETILAQWRWADETGWDSAWTFDHFFSLRPSDDGVCLEGWTLLAALAAQTERLRLEWGVLERVMLAIVGRPLLGFQQPVHLHRLGEHVHPRAR